MKIIKILFLIIIVNLLSVCNNYFHELIPPDENRILSFSIDGQIGKEIIMENDVAVVINGDVEINSLIPDIKISPKAILLPITIDYLLEAFPQIDIFKTAMRLYSAQDMSSFVMEMIKNNPDFNKPLINKPIDFSGPVNFIVISGQGNIRQYKINVEIDEGLPRLISFVFSKYDNPELIRDAYSPVNEKTMTINTHVLYPMEMELSYGLIPAFEILGDKIEVDGIEIRSCLDAIQFNKMIGTQEKIITVWRENKSLDFTLTVVFSEDQDSIRSITDFRFVKTDNSQIGITTIASIMNNDLLGVINIQVFYSGMKPSQLTPRFISPGIVSVAGIIQNTGSSSQDYSSPLEYRVVSRNNMYIRTYTVNVDFVDILDLSPVIKSFKLSSALNPELVCDTTAEIIDSAGQIIIDAAYGGSFEPETLTPEFSATGLVTVYNAVQVSGFSAQNYSRQVKYTVSSPDNPLFSRDYWVQVRFTRDTSSDATIKSFSFHPDDNPGLDDEITGRIDHNAGKITINAPVGSGISIRTMTARFTASGQVSVNNITQTSGTSGQIFNSPVLYKVISANGSNSKEYIVTVRELLSTIYVDCNAAGMGDGTSWRDAFRGLKEACEAAKSFEESVPKEIWIARGLYKPGVNPSDYFSLTANTSYIGGFAGSETAKNQRDAAANKVTISGEIGAGIYSWQLFGAFDGDNVKTINGDIAFEDIEFTSSRAAGSGSRNAGAAIYSVQSAGYNLQVLNCSFNNFHANGLGGAIYSQGSGVDISNSNFLNCSSSSAAGGVLYFSGSGKAELTNVTINSVISGGAVYNIGKSLSISDTVITNTAGTYGIYSTGGLEADNLELRAVTGQGIYITGGVLHLSDLTAANISGRALYFDSSANRAIIENAIFDRCGDVYLLNFSSAQIKKLEITNVNSGITSGLYVSSAAGGNIDIDNVKIDNVPNGRGMEISSTGSVAISESVIKNTKSTVNGSGIFFSLGGANAVLSGITIENAEGGGGIYSGNKPIIIIDSKIINVTGTYGIYANNGLEADRLELRSITGQGINVSNGEMNLSDVTLNNVSGRAVYFSSSADRAVIKNSNFDKCGDVYLYDSYSVQITDIEITDINSGIQNGLYARSSTGGNFDIEKIIINNVPNGRGMEINTTGAVKIFDASIKNTKSTDSGGGINFSGGTGTAVLSKITIENIESGGGIYSVKNLIIENSLIKNVTGTYGIYSSGGLKADTLDLVNITGDGIYVSDGDFKLSGINANNISGSSVSSNTESATLASIENSIFKYCGEINLSKTPSVLVADTVVANLNNNVNSALVISSPIVNIERLTIENVPNGRGLRITGATTNITDCSITNTMVSEFNEGGGIYLYGTNIHISGVTIKNSLANWRGGGIYFTGTLNSITLSNSLFENCRANSTGGAIYIGSGYKKDAIITDTNFINCTANSTGMIIYHSYGEVYLSFIRCTFSHTDSVYKSYSQVDYNGRCFFNVLANSGSANADLLFDYCKFLNLTSNASSGEIYIVDNGLSSDHTVHTNNIIMQNCEINLKAGEQVGIISFIYGVRNSTTFLTTFLLDNVIINNYGSTQPLIYLQGSTNTFKFKPNNSYNGTVLDTAAKITGLGSNIIRLEDSAVPTLAP